MLCYIQGKKYIERNKKRPPVRTHRTGKPPESEQLMTSLFYATEEVLTSAYTTAAAADMPQAWRNALERGYDLLLQSDLLLVEFGNDGNIRTADIPSQSEEDVVYRVNGACSCKAGQAGKPCAHRAAKRILQRCWELSRPAAPAPSYEIVDCCPDLDLADLFEATA